MTRLLRGDAIAAPAQKAGHNLCCLKRVQAALQKLTAESHQIRWRKLLRNQTIVATVEITHSASPFELSAFPRGIAARQLLRFRAKIARPSCRGIRENTAFTAASKHSVSGIKLARVSFLYAVCSLCRSCSGWCCHRRRDQIRGRARCRTRTPLRLHSRARRCPRRRKSRFADLRPQQNQDLRRARYPLRDAY